MLLLSRDSARRSTFRSETFKTFDRRPSIVMPPPPVDPEAPPPAARRTPPPSSSASTFSSWGSLAQQEEAEAIAAAAKLAQAHAKPFSTPPGFEAPSLGEQFSYAARRHPYARLGYGAVFLVGAGTWWLASSSSSSGASEGEKAGKKKT